MAPNVPLLRQTMAQIEANLDLWDQSRWITEKPCGTAYCFAGWTAVLAGARFIAPSGLAHEIIPPGEDKPADVAEFAADLLGIEEFDDSAEGYKGHLFDMNNDLDDLRRIVAELCTEDEVTP